MSELTIVALLLSAGGITYVKTTHNAKVGPFELSINADCAAPRAARKKTRQ